MVKGYKKEDTHRAGTSEGDACCRLEKTVGVACPWPGHVGPGRLRGVPLLLLPLFRREIILNDRVI
jgi:hypothetical protein